MPAIDQPDLDDDQLKALHPEWRMLKGKYVEVLKRHKVKFGKGFGARLDQRASLVKAVRAFPAGTKALIVGARLNGLKANSKALQTVAAAYQTKLNGLGDPAEHDLVKFLGRIGRAAAADVAWADSQLLALKAPIKPK